MKAEFELINLNINDVVTTSGDECLHLDPDDAE